MKCQRMYSSGYKQELKHTYICCKKQNKFIQMELLGRKPEQIFCFQPQQRWDIGHLLKTGLKLQ